MPETNLRFAFARPEAWPSRKIKSHPGVDGFLLERARRFERPTLSDPVHITFPLREEIFNKVLRPNDLYVVHRKLDFFESEYLERLHDLQSDLAKERNLLDLDQKVHDLRLDLQERLKEIERKVDETSLDLKVDLKERLAEIEWKIDGMR